MNEPTLKRKKRLMDRSIKEQKKVLVIATLLVVTLFFGSSYALLSNFKKSSEIVNVTTGNMNMSVTTNQGLINLTGKLPETDESGLANATAAPIILENVTEGPYTDTTTKKFANTSPSTMKIQKYEVLLQQDESQTSTLSDEYVKFAISTDGTTYGTPRILDNADNIIYTGYNLALNTTKTIYVKAWIDGDAGNNGVNKSYYASVSINLYQNGDNAATQITNKYYLNDGLYAVNTDGDLYDETANPAQTIREYRYSGANPNNYIYFNGTELWRIVGVFNGELKIVKDTALSNVTLTDNNYTHTDPDTSVETEFNLKSSETDYGSALYWNKRVSGTSYNDWTTAGLQYYLNDTNNDDSYWANLNPIYRNLIKTNTIYYLGNVTISDSTWTIDATAKQAREQERGTIVCDASVTSNSQNSNCNIWNGNKTAWTGAIGLLYPSDIGYANATSLWEVNMVTFLDNDFQHNNWILKPDTDIQYFYWLLSPSSAYYLWDYSVMRFVSAGLESTINTQDFRQAVRPVLNLKSDTRIYDGDGSIDHPYVLIES